MVDRGKLNKKDSTKDTFVELEGSIATPFVFFILKGKLRMIAIGDCVYSLIVVMTLPYLNTNTPLGAQGVFVYSPFNYHLKKLEIK